MSPPARKTSTAVARQSGSAATVKSGKSKSSRDPGALVIPGDAREVELTVGGRGVKLTNLPKVFWPESGITKCDLLQYYAGSTKRSSEWEPLAPTLVVEVQYDHFSGGRFRHGTSFLRWRPDKSPGACTIAQVEQEGRSAMKLLTAGGATAAGSR